MSEWPLVELGEFIRIKHGFAFAGEYFSDDTPGDILVTPGNFAVGGGFQSGKAKYYHGPVPDGYVLEPGSVIVTMTDLSKAGDTLGYSARVPSTLRRLLHNQRVGLVEIVSDRVLLAFVHWLLRTPAYRNEVLASATGSTVRHTSPSRIEAFRFRLPPVKSQQAISEILDALEEKIDLNQRMNQNLHAVACAFFKDWFVDFGPTRAKVEGAQPYLGNDLWQIFPDRYDSHRRPVGWTSEPIYDQAEWINGAAFKDVDFSDAPAALPVIKIAELKNGVTKNTKRSNALLDDRYRIADGELLFSWSGNPDTSIDAFVWVGGEAWLNQHIFAVRPDGRRSSTFLHWMLKHHVPEFAEIARNKQTTGLGHVTKADLRRMVTCVGDERARDAFEWLVSPMYSMMIRNLKENRTLAQTRDLILPKLMAGEIHIKEVERVLEAAE